jgi:hypothetical protein
MPWYWVQNLPVASSAIVDRFSLLADGCAAALLAFAVDAAWQAVREEGAALTVRQRVLARAAVVAGAAIAVVPVLPAPLPMNPLPGVPAGWSQVVTRLAPEGGTVLTVPVPADTFTTPMRWQADTGLPSDLVAGYFIGPVSGGQAYVGAEGLSRTSLYLNWLWQASGTEGVSDAGLQTERKAPPAKEARSWIKSAHVVAVVAVTRPDSRLATYLDTLLGQPTAQSGDVLGWRVHL